MTNFCRICDHEKRGEIDSALASNEPYILVAKRFRIPMASVLNHRIHLPDEKSIKSKELAQTDVVLLARLKALQEKCLMLILAGEATNDLGTLFSVASEVRKNLEQLGELAEQMHRALRTPT